MSDRDETVKGGKWMDTPDRRGIFYGFYSIFGLERHHGHNWYHPYKSSEKGYFPYEFKKTKPPTLNGELQKLEDAEA